MHAAVFRPLSSHPYVAGVEHAGFSTDQASTSPNAKRGEVFGESYGGGVAWKGYSFVANLIHFCCQRISYETERRSYSYNHRKQ